MTSWYILKPTVRALEWSTIGLSTFSGSYTNFPKGKQESGVCKITKQSVWTIANKWMKKKSYGFSLMVNITKKAVVTRPIFCK